MPLDEERIIKEIYVLIAVVVAIIVVAIIILVFIYFSLFSSNHANSITNTNPYHIVVTPTPIPSSNFNSAFLNDTIPSIMVPGKQYTVTIIAHNTGKTPWMDNTTFIAQFVNSSYDNTSFSNTSTLEPGSVISNGVNYTWKFTMTAPGWNGNYTIAYKMKNTSTWFGDILVKNITVGTPGANVIFTLINIPSTMTENSKVNVTVIVQNMGRYPWYENDSAQPGMDSVQLGINYSPDDGSVFTRTIRLHMNPDSGVMPGQTCKWVYPITAPSYLVQYNVTYQMMQGGNYFGAPTMRTVRITN